MSHTEELERLAKLHQDGELSDEEFASEKTNLLASTPPEVQPPTPSPKKGKAGRVMAFGFLGIITLVIVLVTLGNLAKSSGPRTPDDLAAITAAQNIIKHSLKSPTSAEFPQQNDPDVHVH